jgi:hypothetical protein
MYAELLQFPTGAVAQADFDALEEHLIAAEVPASLRAAALGDSTTAFWHHHKAHIDGAVGAFNHSTFSNVQVLVDNQAGCGYHGVSAVPPVQQQQVMTPSEPAAKGGQFNLAWSSGVKEGAPQGTTFNTPPLFVMEGAADDSKSPYSPVQAMDIANC